MFWLIGAALTFKWLYEKKVLSGKASPRKAALPSSTEPASDGGDSAVSGVGEDFYPESQMIRRKNDPKPAPKPAEPKKAPQTTVPDAKKEEKTIPLPSRKGGTGSFDDVIEDDPPGVGIEEFEELQDPGYNPGEGEEEEES